MEKTLYIFDMNGTLTNTPFVDKTPLAILAGRKEKIEQLQATGAICAVATNQGGVAFGFSTETQATEEVAGIARELGIEHWRVAFGHPKPKWGYEQYGTPEALALRKPEPGMLLSIMEQLSIAPENTIMVGDRDEDRDAADKAGCLFIWAKDFFAEPGELVAQVYGLYRQAVELLNDDTLELHFGASGIGDIGWYACAPFVEWNELSQAPAAIQAAIEEHKKTYAAAVVSNQDFDPFLDGDDLP